MQTLSPCGELNWLFQLHCPALNAVGHIETVSSFSFVLIISPSPLGLPPSLHPSISPAITAPVHPQLRCSFLTGKQHCREGKGGFTKTWVWRCTVEPTIMDTTDRFSYIVTFFFFNQAARLS